MPGNSRDRAGEGQASEASLEKGTAAARCAAFLLAPRDAAPLAAFRIVFGALMAFEAFASYLHKIPERYAPGMFHFTYPGFHWVGPPPGIGIYLVVIGMGLAAFCVTIGYRYRAAAIAFLGAYTYLFLIERAAYNNHYYLIILLAFLFTIVDAHTEASVDRAGLPTARRGWVPAWQIYLFRAQIVTVYFFGGVAKLSPDWLRREPMTHWLQERAEVLTLGPFLKLEIAPYVFSYGGLVFDLAIGFLLLWRRSRPLAIVLVLAFHLTNAWLFSIGVFPWLGIGATLLFLEGHTARGILNRLGYASGVPIVPEAPAYRRVRAPWLTAFCAVYLAIQVLVPLRHGCIPGEVNWTEEGHDFSWHMKLRDKDGLIRFAVVDQETGQRAVLEQAELGKELTASQIGELSCKPVLAAQYARHLRAVYATKGFHDPAVFADSLVSLNGRPYQPILNAGTDLSKASIPWFGHAEWIVALDKEAPIGLFPPVPTAFHD